MPRKRSGQDLSTEELRRLLVDQHRVARQERLEHYQKTGKVAPSIEPRPRRTAWTPATRAAQPAYRSQGRRVLDRVLLVVEIAALAGLIYIVVSGASLLRSLNRDFAAALAHPAASPTPTQPVAAVVLPSGHKPPSISQTPSPNEAEIPVNLLPLAQTLAVTPIPTEGPEQAVRIQIPAIGVDAPVVQGDGWDQLMKGVAQHPGTADPGQKGNVVLSAHNDVFGELFRDLDQLKTGDTVTLLTASRQYTYTVTGTRIVEPTQVDVMDATEEPTVTLISCYPYWVDTQRIVVSAVLQNNP